MEKIVPSLWISLNAQRHPHKDAIIFGDKRISYSYLKDSICKLAGGLSFHGVQYGDRVVILLPNSPEFIISFFAIAMVGAIAVPLNFQYKEQELSHYLKDSFPKTVIVSKHMVPLIRGILNAINNEICRIISVPYGEEGSDSYEHLINGNFSFRKFIGPSTNDDLLCQYSSGSTSIPKKIVRTNFNLASEAESLCSTVDMTDNDRILCVVPLFHAHGFGNCMLASVYTGATLIILENFNHHKVLKIIQDEGVTVFPGVPFMFSILADALLKEKADLHSLRLCFSAGAPLMGETFQKFFKRYGIYVRQLYGSTEAGSVSINLDRNICESSDSVGIPMKNVEVEVFGEKGEILGASEIGEIGIRSPAMTGGYQGSEDLTREFFREGYFFPGDVGKRDDKGRLYLTGRKTLFINTGGNKVDPSEVEMLLSGHPKVKEVVVIGVKGYYGEDMVKAVVVPKSDFDESEIINFCRGKIADYKIPRVVEFREEIPRSPLGKVLRKYLY